MIASILKKVARQTGITPPLKRWILSRISTPVPPPFYSLSPDLLVGLVLAFDHQSLFEGHAYYEFGLFRGFSLWFAEQLARKKAPKEFLLYGFDSFEGLPETAVDAGFYREGEFCAGYELVRENLSKYGADWDRIKLFRGFYSRSLFSAFRNQEKFRPVSIAVIDVDIYESCVLVLEFLRPYIVPGSILIFDDYNDMGRSDEHGERKALMEFEARTGMEKELLFELGRECAGFRVVRAPNAK